MGCTQSNVLDRKTKNNSKSSGQKAKANKLDENKMKKIVYKKVKKMMEMILKLELQIRKKTKMIMEKSKKNQKK